MYVGLPVLHWGAYDDPGWDYEAFGQILRRQGGLGLEIGVGAGRLMRRFLADGLAVHGVDASAEMLQVCRDRAGGSAPTLYAQYMQDLDLPDRYDTIYVPCGSVAVVSHRDDLLRALRRFRGHLTPGGCLAFNLEPVTHDYSDGGVPDSMPTAWRHHIDVDLADGRLLTVERRTVAVDAVEQSWTEQRRYMLFDGESSVAGPEVHAALLHWYHVPEMRLMLALAGYERVLVTQTDLRTPYVGDYRSGPIIFQAWAM